jgi:hypothetical protein
VVNQVRSVVNAPALCAMDAKARQTLNSSGVHTITHLQYLSCSVNLYKLSQQSISGESFAIASSGDMIRDSRGPECASRLRSLGRRLKAHGLRLTEDRLPLTANR